MEPGKRHSILEPKPLLDVFRPGNTIEVLCYVHRIVNSQLYKRVAVLLTKLFSIQIGPDARFHIRLIK